MTAEMQTILKSKRFKWLEGARSTGSHGSCRVGGRNSPVIHDPDYLSSCAEELAPSEYYAGYYYYYYYEYYE